MAGINTDAQSRFFPNAKTTSTRGTTSIPMRNDTKTAKKLRNQTERDVKVEIPSAVKDFARIKQAADISAPIDNSDRISMLKEQIANGEYEVNFDAIADKLLQEIT